MTEKAEGLTVRNALTITSDIVTLTGETDLYTMDKFEVRYLVMKLCMG